MATEVYRKIVELVVRAAEIARTVGISNLLQPGLVKEMIIADILGHELIQSKRDADAHAKDNPNEKYEYLSCKEGGTGQLDRMFKSPPEKPSRIVATHYAKPQDIFRGVLCGKSNQVQGHLRIGSRSRGYRSPTAIRPKQK
jgi:hypothetical protein